jgi:hypothetical protein
MLPMQYPFLYYSIIYGIELKSFDTVLSELNLAFYIDIFEQTALQVVDYIYKSEAINKNIENIQILAIIII